MRKIIIALLALMLMTQVAAASTVTYIDDAEKFVFSPGSQQSPTDLFTDFKGVMPGDSIKQDIVIYNEDSPENYMIKVYIRATGAHEGSEEFLSQMKLTVTGPSDNQLFEAAPSETAQLSDWVCLGSVQSGGEIPLQLTLDVPITMSNDFQDKTGYLDWQFKVEKTEIPPDPADETRTGDSSNMLPLFGICGAALLVLILLAVRRKK